MRLRPLHLGLAVLAASGLAAALAPARARAGGEGRTIAVAVDRSASLRYADPDGRGRAALAFAVALAAGPRDRVLVSAPGVDPPVGGVADELDAIIPALRTIVALPRAAGGSDLAPVFAHALERAGDSGSIVAYSADELDVVDQDGRAPKALLEAARKLAPHPDRKAVNEAARAALLAALPPGGFGKRLLALSVPLPAEARSVPFLEALGAERLELDRKAPLATARALAVRLGRTDLVVAPRELVLSGGGARLDVVAGTRVVLAGEGPIEVEGGHVAALDPDKRFWIVDAEGPISVSGSNDAKVAWLAGATTPLALEAHAWRLASGAVHVQARSSSRAPALVLRAHAGEGAPVALERGADGACEGRLASAGGAKTVSVDVRFGPLELPPVEVPVEPAVVRLAPVAGTPLVAGAAVRLAGKLAGPLPPSLLPPTLAVELSGKGGAAKGELGRSGEGYEGTVTFPAAGGYGLAARGSGDLGLELEPATLDLGPAPVIAARVVGEAGPLILHDGRATVELEVSVTPAADPVPLAARLEKVPGAKAELGGGATVGGATSRVLLIVSGTLEKPAPGKVVLEARWPNGVVARGSVALALRPPLAWKKWAALGLVAVALLWAAIAWQRRRALDRLLARKQLRGLGPSGKITPERYLLREHLVSRRAALVAVGRTSVRVELEKDGRVLARAPEGVELLRLEKGARRGDEVELAHGTSFAALRDPSIRRFVYLEDEPTADELQHRFVPDARSFTEEEQEEHSDLFVLIEDDENLPADSGRLIGGKSARIGASARLGKESARLGDSERLAVDPRHLRGDSARIAAGDSGRIPEAIPKGSASDEPIVIADSAEGRILSDGEVVILDPGSDDSMTDEELEPVSGSGPAPDEGSDPTILASSGDELLLDPAIDPGSSEETGSSDEVEAASDEHEGSSSSDVVITSTDTGEIEPDEEETT